uniref:Pentatricopeptide repeat-containing protein n=1 Tax=Rhizophora mucronata TaxID=61149 RepID=A0A2P2KJI7_RHIMU
MWALRRASVFPRFRGLVVRTSRACCAELEVPSSYSEGKVATSVSAERVSERCIFYSTAKVFSEFCVERRSLSSQAGAKNSELEDNMEDGFSELETPDSTSSMEEVSTMAGNEDELVSEPELLDGDHEDEEDNILESSHILDTETDPKEKKARGKRDTSDLFKAIVSSPNSVHSVLDKWAEEKELSQAEISLATSNFRKRRMYGRALQLSEWLEARKHLDFVERDYASRLDLIAKVRGLQKAEYYVEKKIPESFRGEIIYRTLLASCVSANNAKKAEEVFNKMRDLEFPITLFVCNQLLLLYKRLDKKKIADVLLLMEKENIKPSLFTYKLLIDTKGQSNDITGMDQIVETMKMEGIQPDTITQAILAKHYVSGGLKGKAEAILKEMEGSDLKEHRWACRLLLPLYASLGKAVDVRRVWKVCESSPRLEECTAAVEAWGKLNKIDEAEAVFNLMTKWKKLSSKHYSALLKVYASHKKLAKGKDLVKRMADSGCRIGPLTWDALVKLYVEAGEVEKADSMLQKATEQSQIRPMFSSFMTIMEKYEKRGDIHNSEKMFHRMRQAGYVARHRQFQSLVQTYINAKSPAYGIRERMKADNIFPNKSMAGQLAQVDAFRKTAVTDLLD